MEKKIIYIVLIWMFIGCSKEKCQQCYYIEPDGNGGTREFDRGEFCDGEIESFKEQQDLIVPSSYVECRD